MSEKVSIVSNPGYEAVEIVGAPGYEDERMCLSNSLRNGLRFEIKNEGDEEEWTLNIFHITSPATAKLLAEKLLEYSERIADPTS